MDFTTFSLKELCIVNTNDDNNCFVGMKIENGKPIVYFPLGYHLSDDDKILRKDIRALFVILSTFKYKGDDVLKEKRFAEYDNVDFPISAFIYVIDYYIENDAKYYIVKEKNYKSDSKGKINFKKTIKKENGLIKNRSLIYTKFQVECQGQLDNALIKKIHEFCVYQAFKVLGWLYNNKVIRNPGITLNKKVFLCELRKHYSNANIERDRKLFKSMIAMIEFIDNTVNNKLLYFGTNKFEYVWEKIIDKVFGISNKEDYFPKAVWIERHGSNKYTETQALMPDTIMLLDNKVYILDAKYYRYGTTHKTYHLPGTSSINKQITYGEYINKNKGINKNGLFNAFLMPYDSQDNMFETNYQITNIAEAIGKWRLNLEYYEKIQCILVDVRWLLLNHSGNHDAEKETLSKQIEKYILFD